MSANGNGADESRPSREIAYRLFAAEFDDASFSYSESDEERAPNYVVTPTGARVNRLFAVGVLTEVEPVNDDVLRGRIVDPTGAFVSYAGQYQPDEMAFLDRASPPAFVALSGKARTFQPDDSDRVFTSVRPESMSRVDADTRDRWTVSTAEATLHRVGVMAAALQSGLRGGDLSDALREAGVDEALSKGVPLAIDHYGTTPGYLDALRRLALDALEVVADERDSVRALDVEPGEPGADVELSELAADLDLAAPAAGEGTAASADATTETTATADPAETAATESTGTTTTETTEAATEAAAAEQTPSAATETEDTGTDTVAATESVPEFDEGASTTGTGTTAQPSTTDAGGDSSDEPASPTSASSEAVSESEPTEPAARTEHEETEPTPSADAGDELGDFDTERTRPTESTTETDELGDFDAGDTDTGTNDSPATTEAEPDTGVDDDGMYELDADERAEIEAEFGTEFSTGSEVAPAGEADIDVPSVEELEDELDEELGAPESTSEAEAEAGEPAGETEPAVESEPTTATDTAAESDSVSEPATAANEDEDEGEVAADVDLETVAVEAMATLDDGDGASREAVVAHVVDEYGADPGAVEDAIQSALMSGQCYEPTEDSLKAI
jgi:hypothetical protein